MKQMKSPLNQIVLMILYCLQHQLLTFRGPSNGKSCCAALEFWSGYSWWYWRASWNRCRWPLFFTQWSCWTKKSVWLYRQTCVINFEGIYLSKNRFSLLGHPLGPCYSDSTLETPLPQRKNKVWKNNFVIKYVKINFIVKYVKMWCMK